MKNKHCNCGVQGNVQNPNYSGIRQGCQCAAEAAPGEFAEVQGFTLSTYGSEAGINEGLVIELPATEYAQWLNKIQTLEASLDEATDAYIDFLEDVCEPVEDTPIYVSYYRNDVLEGENANLLIENRYLRESRLNKDKEIKELQDNVIVNLRRKLWLSENKSFYAKIGNLLTQHPFSLFTLLTAIATPTLIYYNVEVSIGARLLLCLLPAVALGLLTALTIDTEKYLR